MSDERMSDTVALFVIQRFVPESFNERMSDTVSLFIIQRLVRESLNVRMSDIVGLFIIQQLVPESFNTIISNERMSDTVGLFIIQWLVPESFNTIISNERMSDTVGLFIIQWLVPESFNTTISNERMSDMVGLFIIQRFVPESFNTTLKISFCFVCLTDSCFLTNMLVYACMCFVWIHLYCPGCVPLLNLSTVLLWCVKLSSVWQSDPSCYASSCLVSSAAYVVVFPSLCLFFLYPFLWKESFLCTEP